MHDRHGECAVGARTNHQRHVGLLHGRVPVDIDRHDLCAAFLAGADGVGHHVDLRGDRVRAPDHDAVGLRHFPWVRTSELACSGGEDRP